MEEWRATYGEYLVSSQGRIKSLKYGKEKIIKPFITNKGYLETRLRVNKQNKLYYIHRLVAEAFIPNPNNYKEVNHKDREKLNNNVENLEWCTHKYNTRHSNSTSIIQYDLQNNIIRKWECMSDAAKELGIKIQNISNCCIGKKYYKTAGGFKWSYENK